MVLITVSAKETVGVSYSFDLGSLPRDQQSLCLKLNRVLFFKGPLTHTSPEEVTTVYGIVSHNGDRDVCFGTNVFTNVAFPAVLNWIRKTMGNFVFFDNKLL